jgi:hypothetical protein
VRIVTDLDLPVFDRATSDLAADVCHQRLASARKHGWLARSPPGLVVLDREAGEFFLRAKLATFPGRMLANLAFAAIKQSYTGRFLRRLLPA